MAKEGTTYNDLRAAIARKEFAPVYLFHGEEDFLADEAITLIVDAALTVDERGFNLDVMYGIDADARDVISHASSFPMMAERRVVVVHEFDRLSGKEIFTPYIERPSPTTVLILDSEKPDFRKKPYITAKKHGVVVECNPLREYQVPGWISDRVRMRGKTIEPDASKMLTAYIGSSLREIDNEIEKLYSFTAERRTISADDVAAVVGVSRQYNIFELQRAVGLKDVPRSTEILQRMLDAGDSPTMIIVMLTRYFAALWKLSQLQGKQGTPQQQASAVGVHPFYLKEYLEALTRFSLNEIEESFLILTDTDERLKSTSTEEEILMHLALAQILGLQEELSV